MSREVDILVVFVWYLVETSTLYPSPYLTPRRRMEGDKEMRQRKKRLRERCGDGVSRIETNTNRDEYGYSRPSIGGIFVYFKFTTRWRSWDVVRSRDGSGCDNFGCQKRVIKCFLETYNLFCRCGHFCFGNVVRQGLLLFCVHYHDYDYHYYDLLVESAVMLYITICLLT